MTTIRVPVTGGLAIVADELGDAHMPTVILGHGGGQTRHSWDRAGQDLAEAGYHVINYDLLGHGESDWEPDGDYSLERRARDLGAIAERASGPFAFVGASLGGLSAMAAACHGAVPVALVLVDVVVRLSETGVDRIIGFMSANPQGFGSLDEAAEAISAYYPDRKRPSNADGLRKNLREGADGRLYWHWDPRFLTGGRPGVSLEEMFAKAEWTQTVPTLLVRGMKSDIVTDEGVDHLAGQIKRFEIADISGAGHMVAGDRNDLFNAAVIDFLARAMPTVGNRALRRPA
ncbi:MAG: alpha/beta fold hydrolase [Novosphingobium sp.]